VDGLDCVRSGWIGLCTPWMDWIVCAVDGLDCVRSGWIGLCAQWMDWIVCAVDGARTRLYATEVRNLYLNFDKCIS